MSEMEEISSNGGASAGPAPPSNEASYDPSLLIMVKGKAKKPLKPDDSEKNLQVQKLQAEINKYSDRIKQIKELIDNKHSSAKGVTSGTKELIQKLSSFNNERAAVLVRSSVTH